MDFLSLSPNLQQEVPEKLKDTLIMCEKIGDSVFLVNSSNLLFEIKNKSILRKMSLIPQVEKLEPSTLNRLRGFYHYNPRALYILVKINSDLIVVQETTFEISKVFNSILNFQFVDEFSDGNCKVEIQLHGSTILTNFVESTKKHSSISAFPGIVVALEEIRKSTDETKIQLKGLENSISNLFRSVDRSLKFLPVALISENVDENKPLIRYGDTWIRVHNERVIIGIPVLNSTYKRKLVLDNLRLLLHYDFELESFEFEWMLYKMRTDCYSFENFEELYDEQISQNSPNFQQDWKLCQKRYLNPEQSGIFVVTIDVQNFLEHLEYNFKVFLTYNLHNGTTIQMHACNLLIDPQIIWHGRYQLDFTKKEEIYKNLLALTSTSFNVSLNLVYKEIPKKELADFLLNTLEFWLIKTPSNTHLDQQSFYMGENYFKGLVIRTDKKSSLLIKLKLYSKFYPQIVKFIQSIYANYGEECLVTFESEFDKEIVKEKLEQNLMQEITHNLESQENFNFIQNQFYQEMLSDICYQKLNEKS